MLVYVDSSGLIKRAVREAESIRFINSMQAALAAGHEFVSSTLAWIEVSRAMRNRLDSESPAEIAALTEVALSGVGEIPITAQVASIARRIGPPMLRTLDAIHLASATIFDVDEVWAYDRRLIDAADGLGLVTASPA
ncbi:type II toxin-antitoxin system VapC family toxin [Agromyces neolithicus]|uniref:Type II toxin-antitoxin system VapC family toxin n=1 Tax=Agromyces neolithicus TaxID=269420 RepID=A0ABN2LR46_9MICO